MGGNILSIVLMIVGIVFCYKAYQVDSGFAKFCGYIVGIFFLVCGGVALDESIQKQNLIEQSYGDRVERVNSNSNPSFTGNSHRKYVCGYGGCLCTKYEKKSTYNTDCKNCFHAKSDHY